MILAVPAGIGLAGVCAWWLLGQAGLIVPLVLLTMFVAWLMVDLRHHQDDLFQWQAQEQRAIYGQLEALMGLNAVLHPVLPLPPTRGWAVSPDLMREVVSHVLSGEVSLAVEASSGTSTVMIAYAMERKGAGRVIALEHDAHYAARTHAMIAAHGLSHRATVVHAPLVDHALGGSTVRWYDLSAAGIDTPIDLLLVDGPPEESAPMARYPAVPLLRARLSAGARVILDDGARADERTMAERWRAEQGATSCEYLALEKGAWSLRF